MLKDLDMAEIDVTNKVMFSTVHEGWTEKCFVQCVCGEESKIFPEFYNKETRMLLNCSHCGAKLYFRDAGEGRNRIVQVVDE